MKRGILEPGTLIGGRYVIRRLIGTGGMSRVYLVEDPKIGKEWAMKVAAKETDDPERLERKTIAAEISVLQKLSHPGLPRIVDAVESESAICIIMDYIEGKTLLEMVREQGALPQADVVDWGLQLADVLEYLHSLSPPIIYRDMKPGNIMLRSDGRVVLFDFGIAREYKNDRVADTTCLGTVGYAAPEQFGGFGQSDERTDIYGLGASLYHLLTGADPAKPPYEMVPIRSLNPSLSSGLEKIIATCTQKNPEDRYRDCRALKAALMNFKRLDQHFLKEEKRKAVLFFSSLALGVVFTVLSIVFAAGALKNRRLDYTRLLTEAGNRAAVSLYSGIYDPEVLSNYTTAIDLAPGIEDAYLNLLDYCVDIGATTPGLNAVCARINTAQGRKMDEVIFRAAELYFFGNANDPEFEVNYRRAARYFSMIDQKRYPEAAGCEAIASALGDFGRDINWKRVAEELEVSFTNKHDGPMSTRTCRSILLASQVYLTNRRELEEVGIDAVSRAEMLLNGLADELEQSNSSGDTESKEMYLDVIEKLAGIYEIDSETAQKAAEYYEFLANSEKNKSRKREYELRRARAAAASGDVPAAKQAFEETIANYPNESEGYFVYCAWLLEIGESDEAKQWFRLGSQCADAGDRPNYLRMRQRLEGLE